MSDYPMLISNKLHSFRNFEPQISTNWHLFFHPLIVIKGLFNILLIFSWTRRGFRSLFTVYHHKDGRHRHNKGLHRHEDGRRYP